VDTVWRYQEEVDTAGKTVYGGVAEGERGGGLLLGGTAHYLGPDLRPLLTGVVSIDARGRVGSQELQFARENGVPVIDVQPALPRYSYFNRPRTGRNPLPSKPDQ